VIVTSAGAALGAAVTVVAVTAAAVVAVTVSAVVVVCTGLVVVVGQCHLGEADAP
jgi:hypothetical protein